MPRGTAVKKKVLSTQVPIPLMEKLEEEAEKNYITSNQMMVRILAERYSS